MKAGDRVKHRDLPNQQGVIVAMGPTDLCDVEWDHALTSPARCRQSNLIVVEERGQEFSGR